MALEVLVVLVTCPPDAADRLADLLVEKRLAACVNIVAGLRSVYRWQGAVQRDAEALMIVKTSQDRFDDLKAAILAHHPYELPEIIAMPVDRGHAPYLAWVVESTR